MALISRMLLFFLAVLPALATSGAHGDGNLTLRCHPDQAATLLQLKESFSFGQATTSLPSWQDGSDCCGWEGVGCAGSSGHVRTLNLSGRGLYSLGLDPVIFNLTSLQVLDLSKNNFAGYNMPSAGFERLTLLTHLSIFKAGLQGWIPNGIGKLENLISLDLSNRYDNSNDEINLYGDYHFNALLVSSFQNLVENLTNLRELYLDSVDINSSGEEYCQVLAKYVPRLEVLSLEGCLLYGPLHQSLSNLSSLTVINLRGNNGISAGLFPEFFMDFVNLSVLQLAYTNLEGLFPRRIFQSEILRVLDLSGNPNLHGNLPNLSNASSLETLNLDGTNFSYAKPSSSSNFISLQELSLDGGFISMKFLASFSMLGSLSQLLLTRLGLRDLGSLFSWIGYLKNLTSLELVRCDLLSTHPSSISNLKSLRSLTIVNCNLSISILSAIANLKDLRSLEIIYCRLNGAMPPAIGNLTNLRRLDINDCGFLGPMPSSIGNLVNLRNLYITSCIFSGPIPSTVGFLRKLERLEISGCKFSGPMPSAIGNLSNLKFMDIYDSEIPGPIPCAVQQLKELTTLVLVGSKFSEGIPNSLGNLTRLQILDLSMNLLTGEIPTSLFTFPVLHNMDLHGNQLSGPIQEFDVASSCLVHVDLGMNELTGQIPRSLFELTNLEFLNLGSNNLVGSVDLNSFWRLTKLNLLSLSNNKLSVMDGEENKSSFTYPSKLTILELACCNMTKFPNVLTSLNYVSSLDLGCNRISGDIPKWIWERWDGSISYLNLSHNMLTGFQLNSSVLPLSTSLYTLDLSSNRLQGQAPMPNSSASYLDYSHNNFSSVLPNFTLYLGDTVYLKMSNNSISGRIPNSICSSLLSTSELMVEVGLKVILDLSYNNFGGPIPSCLIENVGLAVLNLRENHFEGTLASNITSECTLQTIDLHGNKIEGQLPRALSNCSYLEVFDIGENFIVDTFPSWLGELSNLYVLILRSNQFYGSIGDLVGDHLSSEYFSSLKIIDLSSNNFSGKLSPKWFAQLDSMMAKSNGTGGTVHFRNLESEEYYQDSTEITYKGSYVIFERILTTLTAIDLSDNRLEGSIPESAGQLVSLHVLNMSHNAFSGKIPAKLGGMADLESLDLSCNQLSGEIPQELTDLTFLGTLNLSENQLVGKIPQLRQFFTFDKKSFEGNLGLCGLPLSNPCGVSHAPSNAAHAEKLSHVDVILFLFVGIGFGIGFAGTILVRWGQIVEWFVKSARALRT